MVKGNSKEETEFSSKYPSYQNITDGTAKLLQSSSTVHILDPGSTSVTTSQMMGGETLSQSKWYYMFLHSKEMRQFIDIFTGKQEVVIATATDADGKTARRYNYKVFPYTSVSHKKRFEQCTYNNEAYQERKEAAFTVKEAFESNDTSMLNAVTSNDVSGDGYLFVCGPLKDIQEILSNTQPRQYLATRYKSTEPAQIASREMEEFIYLYESMPYNIEVMSRPLADYVNSKQRIRITSGIFKGKEGCIMRLHRNTRIVLAIGNMTVAISNLHAFPYEKV